ncbi:MAG: hypothetical protein K2K55_09370 [Duncaniella sp.]|nr:hypothetical protein [Duncaniella sp.]
MKPDYSLLIRKTIELEGLLRVALESDAERPELASMLAEKSEELAQALALNGFAESEVTETVTTVETPDETEINSVTEKSFSDPMPEQEEEPDSGQFVQEDPDEYDDDFETTEMAADKDQLTTPVKDIFSKLQRRVEDIAADSSAPSLMQLFSLNDKFRFRRELFDNSEEAFEEAITQLGYMSTIDEASEYLTEDLCLDPSRDEVKDFITILGRHFS